MIAPHNARVINFCVRDLGGIPLHDYILNHEIIFLAQVLGLDLGLKFRWVDEGFAKAGPRSDKLSQYLAITTLEEYPTFGLSNQIAQDLRKQCNPINQKLFHGRPANLNKEVWRQILIDVYHDRPLTSENVFYRRQATLTLYGDILSRYDRILASVV